MNTRHVTSLVAAGAAIVMLLSGCGSTGTSNSSNASDSNIISVYGSEPAHPLFPGNTTEAGGGKVVDQLFAGLVTYDAKGGIHNEVADSITSSDNATHYVIKLKSGWKFIRRHSGDRALLRKRMELHRQQCQQAGQRQLLQHNRRL